MPAAAEWCSQARQSLNRATIYSCEWADTDLSVPTDRSVSCQGPPGPGSRTSLEPSVRCRARDRWQLPENELRSPSARSFSSTSPASFARGLRSALRCTLAARRDQSPRRSPKQRCRLPSLEDKCAHERAVEEHRELTSEFIRRGGIQPFGDDRQAPPHLALVRRGDLPCRMV